MEATPPKPQTPPDQTAPTVPDAGAGDKPGPRTAEQQALATHATDPHERIDGLRAWLAQLDRKLGVRTYAFAAACVLALAAAAVALVFALQLQEDSATTDDLDELRRELGTVEQSASEAAVSEVQSLSDRLDTLESQVSSLSKDQSTTQQELQVVQDDIEDLRTDLQNVESSSGSGSSSDTFDSSSTGGTGSSP